MAAFLRSEDSEAEVVREGWGLGMMPGLTQGLHQQQRHNLIAALLHVF